MDEKHMIDGCHMDGWMDGCSEKREWLEDTAQDAQCGEGI